ncbi:MAG TPA: hypothetical protein VLW51_04345 [Solirubrobacteraceae bacterium]|nr:hypothetical protein [Solirubrobacteraceae bacterium]
MATAWRSFRELVPLVIVAASLAGLRAAQAARNAGFDGELVLVGEERHLPYPGRRCRRSC